MGKQMMFIAFFPQAMLHAFSKSNVDFDRLFQNLQAWHSTPPLIFAEDLRQSISLSIENTLYALAEHSSDNLIIGLKTLLASDQSPQVDIEHTIQVLSTLIERGVFGDNVFVKKIEETIKQLSLEKVPPKKEAKDIVSSIQDLYMFYEPPQNDNIIRTGDLVEIELVSKEKPLVKQAIVITPACDLANPRKTIFLRLALIEDVPEEDKGTERDCEWKYQYKDKQFRVCFHQILVLRNETLQKDEKLKVLMSYAHPYITFENNLVSRIQRLKRLGEPYCSDLLHRFVSHAGRIGQPDFSAATLVSE
jgi:hypothetical protein